MTYGFYKPQQTSISSVNEELITPEIATDILSQNSINRNIRLKHLAHMINAFRENRIKFNGETIKIAKSGRLLDGQHRLMACVKTGVSFKTLVVRNLEEDVFDTIDTGSKRSSSDALSIQGVKNPAVISGAIRWLLAFKSGNPMSYTNIYVDPQQVLTLASKYPNLQNSTHFASKLKYLVGHPTMVAALHYVLHEIYPRGANQYFNDLADGVGQPAAV